ncbi:DUF547 domain-containing protein [Neolewinella antarctica]|uniref:DUF547 domain-containing protein n=1 Tax=Neolewinella antarctica TaxID=442734 RepID=A0ABX0X6M0_9BACT|nr:DUF547 domain-containing protein [Neolewinella antarctica]NJC24528.1 hypothetical protein [Neolewinella antarctica]
MQRYIHYAATLCTLLILLSSCGRYQASENYPPAGDEFVAANDLSQRFLQTLKDGGDASSVVTQLETYDPNVLAADLSNREQQLAFWVNTYNGMVQYLLTEDPALFDDRGAFFSTPRFTVAGHLFSPNEMEHGIIRGGENRLGLGFLPQFFPNKFERTFKIKGGDSRVHFALNCGAADCPPVEIYRPETYNEQIDNRVTKYLAKHSEIKTEGGDRVLYTSPLFSWFRGDFRDQGGIDEFLINYGVLTESDKDVSRQYTDYDWTLKTGIWAEE